MQGDAVARGLVECALPPAPVVVGIPFESLAADMPAGEIEDAHLLTGKGGERAGALGRDE